jgi:histone H4
MSGKGKRVAKGSKLGGKYLTSKRHQHFQNYTIDDLLAKISPPAIVRMGRRAGVKRISGDVYGSVRKDFKVFLDRIINDAITYTEYEGRKTVTNKDIYNALARNDVIVYGVV